MAERDDEADREPTTGNADGEPATGESLPGTASATSEASEEDIRHLLRGALERDLREAPDVLSGVQRKLRQRSRGKFYADGWSTSRHPPIQTYLVTSLVMLAVTFFVYAVLSPLSGSPVVAEPPAPVKVLPPTLLPSARP